ncbi:iron-sulfur protein NUBPL [Aethina tumida]|uniref:iron-sulfur protein NUBPL n=1 Tax=Aethina tumida TaxID=116153 RepID=UPI00096B53A2|nr:iron-sulfur protein NUBPL [Aethina tumida]
MNLIFNSKHKKLFSSFNTIICRTLADKSNVEHHRAKVMAKGLPVKKPITNVKHIVLVSSGKGGVGKSTTAVNIAAALRVLHPEKNVGLLDADIFGPTIPLMMNLNDVPLLNDNNLMEPLVNYGIKCMSMGFLIEEGAALIWRGLMVMQALDKLMRQVEWGPTDYLIVDTPPGTGDTHLSLVQNLPISGVVLITTPQNASLQVTKRGGVMYKKLNVPLIGIIENMSHVVCPSCSSNIEMFGNGIKDLSRDLNCKIMERFPIQKEISVNCDKGIPIVINEPDSSISQQYRNVAKDIIDFLEADTNKVVNKA